MKLFLQPGQVAEIRALNVKTGNYSNTHSGYFDHEHIDQAVEAVLSIRDASGVYITLNPCHPALLARSANRMRNMGKGDASTSDADIAHRRWILIDLDVERPSGISATDEEKAHARALADQVRKYLTSQGWPNPVLADSGNGFHLYYMVDLPTNDDGLVKRILMDLAQRFNEGPAKVDTAVFNPARITKLMGTMARKGDDTPNRPHRQSRLISVPETINAVPQALLEALAGQAEPGSAKPVSSPITQSGAAYDVAGFLARNGLNVSAPKPYAEGGQIWIFDQCPWRESDGATAFVAQLSSGAVTAGCQHNTCPGSKGTGNHWAELRDKYRNTEPARLANTELVVWEDPLPLISRVDALPYPLDALPESIHDAVLEVQNITQAPVEMVAASALAALSIAAQGHCDIKRSAKLTGPTSLFHLVIADSGERKSTLDLYFLKQIRAFQDAQIAAAALPLAEYKARLDTWESKKSGLKDSVRAQTKRGVSTGKAENDLLAHEKNKPAKPRVPRLLFSDVSSEELLLQLASGWPSAAVVSSEAGAVLGSYAMQPDTVMRTLANYNQLWDGATITVDRKTTSSFTVKSARFSVSLQVQEIILRDFLGKAGAGARGSGFLARFLVSWPKSTQGTRLFREPPAAWPALEAFNKRIQALLELPTKINSDGSLSPTMLELSPEAKEVWVRFHDRIETQLVVGGDLFQVRDCASKIADNAVRIAALLHQLDFLLGPVGIEAMKSGCRLAEWHLKESQRFFGELALPKSMADAAHLEEWCLAWHRDNGDQAVGVPTRIIQRLGPNALREQTVMDSAARELARLGRAQLVVDGKKRHLLFNPALLGPSTPAPPPLPKPKGRPSKAADDRLKKRIAAAKPKRPKYV